MNGHNYGEIPRFVEELAYLRGLNVGITIGLQSLSQLKKKYKDSCEMSGRKTINNRAFRKWNSSIYEFYSRTKEYRIKKDFENKVSYAVPKKIKWD